MRRFILYGCFVACLLLAGCARHSQSGDSGVTVRTTGDAQIYGVYRNHLR